MITKSFTIPALLTLLALAGCHGRSGGIKVASSEPRCKAALPAPPPLPPAPVFAPIIAIPPGPARTPPPVPPPPLMNTVARAGN